MICLLVPYLGLDHLDMFNIYDKRARESRKGAIQIRSCSYGCVDICRGFDWNPSPGCVIKRNLQQCDYCKGIGGGCRVAHKASDDAGHARLLGAHRSRALTARRGGAREFDSVNEMCSPAVLHLVAPIIK